MCDKCDKLIAKLEQIDLNALRIIPAGADNPLEPSTEADWTITPEDVKRAIKAWNELMPELAGILEATIATQKDTGERKDTDASKPSGWVYHPPK